MKTAIITRKKIAAVVRTTAMAEEETAAAVEIAVTIETAAAIRTAAIMGIAAALETIDIAARALKIFRKSAIIATEEKTAIVAARASKKEGFASFHRREKYIWINDNAVAFA